MSSEPKLRSGAAAQRSRRPLDAYLADLVSSDAERRIQARHALVGIGSAAVPSLLAALGSPDGQMRAGVVQTLIGIADPSTANTLTRMLDDDDASVRWLAAEALIALQQTGLRAALHSLIVREPASPQLKGGVRHVVQEMSRQTRYTGLLRPLLDALDDYALDEVLMVEAHKAMTALGRVPVALSPSDG